MTQAIVLMGVSGSGKTSVGQALSAELGWPFFDGDDFHPPGNVRKMARGVPLNDEDRAPWLMILRDLIRDHARNNQPLILACSALKKNYREALRSGNAELTFIYLKGSFDLIWSRIAARPDHYMKPEMLAGQFEALEEPAGALVVDIDHALAAIVEQIRQWLDASA